MFVPQNLLNTVYNGISAESSMYKDGWKEINDVEMKKKVVESIIFIGIYKSK